MKEYRNIKYFISQDPIPRPHGSGIYEGYTQFGEDFFQVTGESYAECEKNIKKGIDFIKANEEIKYDKHN